MYFQDDWRVTDRLTVNAGLRYDLVTGFDLDQSDDPELRRADRCGRRGTLQRRRGLRGVRTSTPARTSTTSSRASAPCTTCRGDGKDIVRAGWGIYYDFGFTNANILFPGLSAQKADRA